MAWYSRFFPTKKKVVTVIKPTKASVVVTDRTGGGSTTTTKVTSGTTGKTTTTVRRSRGGGSSAPAPTTITSQVIDPIKQQSIMPPRDAITQAAPRTGLTIQRQVSSMPTSEMPNGGSKKDTLFTFGKTEPVPSFGVPVITKEEREKGAVGFVPQVTTVDQLIDAPAMPFIQRGSGTFITPLVGRTKEDIIFTQRNVLEAEKVQRELVDIKSQLKADPESFIGKEGVEVGDDTITLTDKFFEGKFQPSSETVVQAKKFFTTLPKRDRVKAGIASVGTGLGDVGAGLVEFGGTLITSFGQQKITEEDIKFGFGKQLSFPGGFGEQPGLPTTTGFLEDPTQFVKEKATSPQLLTEAGSIAALTLFMGGGAVRNIKKLGVTEGSLATIGELQPFKIKPGVFTTKLSETTKTELRSFKLKEGDLTGRIIVGAGKEDPFSIVSFQASKGKSFSRGGTLIEAPATVITPSGRVETGLITRGTESFSLGQQGAKVGLGRGDVLFDLPSVRGGISNTVTQKRFTLLETPSKSIFEVASSPETLFLGRGAGVTTKPDGFISKFTFGRGQRVFKTELGDKTFDIDSGRFLFKSFIREPTSKVRFEPTITGKEFDLNKLMGSTQEGIVKVTGGKKKTPFKDTFQIQQQGLTQQVSGIQTSLNVVETPSITSTRINIKPTSFGSQKTKQISRQFDITLPKTGQVLEDKISLSPRSLTKQSSSLIPKEKEVSRSLIISRVETAQKSRQAQKQRMSLRTRQVQTQIQTGVFETSIIAPTAGLGFKLGGLRGFDLPDLPKFFKTKEKKKKTKVKKKKKGIIRPSFTGIVAGVEGAAIEIPRLGITPFQIRGLKTGF